MYSDGNTSAEVRVGDNHDLQPAIIFELCSATKLLNKAFLLSCRYLMHKIVITDGIRC